MFLILEEPEYLEKGNITASGGKKAWFQSYCNLYSYIHVTILYTFCNMKLEKLLYYLFLSHHPR